MMDEETPKAPATAEQEEIRTPAAESFNQEVQEIIGIWESMDEAVLEEMTEQGGGGQDGEHRHQQLRRGDQGDGGEESHHLRVRPGVWRVSRSSKEFDDLRLKFEKQDIKNEQPHSMKTLRIFYLQGMEDPLQPL